MSWWDKATQEDRLKQIDAGISLGMSAKQIAICLGAPLDNNGGAVRVFGNRHGRKFQTTDVAIRSGRVGGVISRIVTGRKHGRPETFDREAFSIFSTPDEPNPFNALLPEPVE